MPRARWERAVLFPSPRWHLGLLLLPVEMPRLRTAGMPLAQLRLDHGSAGKVGAGNPLPHLRKKVRCAGAPKSGGLAAPPASVRGQPQLRVGLAAGTGVGGTVLG